MVNHMEFDIVVAEVNFPYEGNISEWSCRHSFNVVVLQVKLLDMTGDVWYCLEFPVITVH